MSKKCTLSFTAAEKKAIDDGWYALKRLVEINSTIERRVDALAKSETKEFGLHSGRALVLEQVLRGTLCNGNMVQIQNLSLERDEKILAFMVGVWLQDYTMDRQTELHDMIRATNARNDAHVRYLESIR